MGVTVAALYVDPRGVYSGREDVECWGLPDRDAREYAGPWPVVAHPPCQRWINLGAMNFSRWGGEHNRPGNDGGTFASALAAVRKWGGVLEHPAYSMAWAAHDITPPMRGAGWTASDFLGGWTCQVNQGQYGHPARKATWLYAVRCALPSLDWSTSEGSALVGYCGNRCRPGESRPRVTKARASATPPAFAEILIAMARSARRDAAELCSRRESVGPWG